MSSPEDEITRREWLLRLGGAASLFGFSGAPSKGCSAGVPAGEHLLAEASAYPASQEPAAQALPPGLYEPSNDHMTHALTSDERFRKIPPGCETDFVTPRTGPFEPRFFSAQEFSMVRRLLELTLGEAEVKAGSGDVAAGSSRQVTADSPGQDVVAEIGEWIDLVVSEAGGVRQAARSLSPQHRALAKSYYGPEVVERLETAQPDKVWREGLNWLAVESQNRYGQPFPELSEMQALELLALISDGRQDRGSENAGTRLFQLLKAQTIQGFYTSQRGLKELDFKGNAFYAECPGCPHDTHS